MIATLAAFISYIVITAAPIAALWLAYAVVEYTFGAFGLRLNCKSCGHTAHHCGVTCGYNRIPLNGHCTRCKHPHTAHIGTTDADGRITGCDCGGAVSGYINDMFGYGREPIDPEKFETDTPGLINVHGRPLYVHIEHSTIYVDESKTVGYRDVEYNETKHVPTQLTETRTRRVRKQVPVVKTRKVDKIITPGGDRTQTTQSTKTKYGIIEHSRSETYPVSVKTSHWTGSGYTTSWHTEYKTRCIPARYGYIPYTATDTHTVYVPPVVETRDETYTDMEWQEVEEEYEAEVTEPVTVTRTKQVPVIETIKVARPHKSYTFTCACRACKCALCVSRACECAHCDCVRCRVLYYAKYLSVIIPTTTTGAFIGIIPITLGIESMLMKWVSLIDTNNINYGFVFIVFGASHIIATIIVIVWYIGARNALTTVRRSVMVAAILYTIIVTQLASLCVFAAVPIIVWLNELAVNVLPCYIIAIVLIVAYSMFWIIVRHKSIQSRIYGNYIIAEDPMNINIDSVNYGTLRLL
ncbi:hypothetical protein F-M6_0100 [Faustovirus]|nr:hypothetical protein F-M6_0100 [Faustovirus]